MVKNQLKYYSSLLKKKYRNQEKKFLIEGIKVLLEALQSVKWASLCEIIFVAHRFVDENPEIINQLYARNFIIEKLNEQDFNKLSDTVSPQGIAAVFKMPEQKVNVGASANIIAALENISDPGNVGTILRNCDWFGVNDVVISAGSAELFNPKTVRSSMGSLFHLNINFDAALPAYIKTCKQNGYEIILADLRGENIFSFKTDKKIIIVFANEANGPGKEMINLADRTITIPKLGKAESLNVASASAVILSQLTRT